MMTATPIPRTLAMTYFADLEVSTIDELPPGRTPVLTKVFAEARRGEVVARIRDELAQGRQVYWVCPLIEESEALDLRNATQTHAELSAALPGCTRRAAARAHEAGREGGGDGAVQRRQPAGAGGTTVIEVGVDVPNASLMVVEHAERFGLSQLHQLRGRVGRGAAASVCVLLYTAPLGDTGKARLKALLDTQDGFEIARRDLEIRGPGEFMGARQSGDALLRFADLAEDDALLQHARRVAPLLLDQHPEAGAAACAALAGRRGRVPEGLSTHNASMTLTELRYIVAVARERHFGRAAEACFVSQPTLSVAIKKLEEELEVKLFERGGNEVSVTPLGEDIVRQAQAVIEQAAAIKEIAKRGKDPLAGPLRLGIIYTIGPYLLPDLVRQVIERSPQMPLMLQENFTVKLLEMLRTGELDCAILAEPFPDTGLAVAPLYDEPFMAAVPMSHPLAERKTITAEELKQQTMLLLGTGHCFRDHVLEVCPEFARFSSDAEGIRKSFEGSSLETIKHMVASGMGVTVVPRLSVDAQAAAACALHPVRRAGAHAPRGAGLAAQLHALRGHRRAAQCGLRLQARWRDAAVLSGRRPRLWPACVHSIGRDRRDADYACSCQANCRQATRRRTHVHRSQMPVQPCRRRRHHEPGLVAQPVAPGPAEPALEQVRPAGRELRLRRGVQEARLLRAEEGPAGADDRLAGLVAGRLRPLRPAVRPHGLARRRHLPHRRRPRRRRPRAAALRAAEQLARQRQHRQVAPPAVADQAEVRPEDLLGRPAASSPATWRWNRWASAPSASPAAARTCGNPTTTSTGAARPPGWPPTSASPATATSTSRWPPRTWA